MRVGAARWLIACALLIPCREWCQTGDISVNSRPSHAEILSWLNSNDSRLIAWGAYFAGTAGDDSATPTLVRLVQDWKPSNSKAVASWWTDPGMASVLDSLIVRDRQVPPDALIAITESFPTEAMILVAKLPSAEARPLLLNWYDKRKTEKNSAYPRIAAMLLSQDPPPGFAGSLLDEMEVNLEVGVTLPGHGFVRGVGSSASCGDSGGAAPKTGWPPLFFYQIEENAPRTNGKTLVSAGGDRITYERLSVSAGWGSCFYPRGLMPETRFHLLAQMLGIPPDNVPWQPKESANVVWKDNGQYLFDLQKTIAAEEARIKSTVLDLRGKGFLTAQEAETVRPHLSLTVTDARYPGLPHLKATDARTSISYRTRDQDSGAESIPHP